VILRNIFLLARKYMSSYLLGWIFYDPAGIVISGSWSGFIHVASCKLATDICVFWIL